MMKSTLERNRDCLGHADAAPGASRLLRACRLLLVAGAGLLLAGCSINKVAINKLSDALAGSGTTYASDDDPELVKSAAPFSLKLIESLLEQNPRHAGLLLAAASGFTQYGFAFVQQEADETEDKDLARATALRDRARRLYIRARNYGFRGLELTHPGFQSGLHQDVTATLQACRKADVPFLYWTAAAWAAAMSLSKDNPEFVADVPVAQAMMDRALALDEAFGDGAIHSFFITYEMSRADGVGDPAARARKHFARAMELARGQQAGPLVSLAEAVALPKQDRAEFEKLLNQALAVKPEQSPEWRLVNLVMQQRARWLLSRVDDLFLAPLPGNGSTEIPASQKP